MELFFEIQMMSLQIAQTEDLTEEELRQLMSPTSTLLIQLGKPIAAALGQRLSSWGSRLAQIASA